jgi:hypothetical protein
MLSYKEMDNLAAVEIEISARVSTEEFDRTAKKLEAFIGRHGRVRVLEIVNHFEGMDAKAFWHDLKFSLRHLNDFSRCAIVSDAKFSRSGPPWPSRSSIAGSPISSRKRSKPRGTGCFGLRAPPISSESTNLQSIVDLRSFP